MLTIDYITAHDPHDIKTWSGLNYFIMKALEAQGAKINVITGLSAKPDFGLKWRYHWFRYWGKNYQYERTHCYTRQFGAQVTRQLSKESDVVFSTASEALSYIETDKPVVLYKDGLFENVAEYYLHFSRLPNSSRKMGNATEQLALNNCTQMAFSSEWVANTAIDYYHIAKEKVCVIPFGANILNAPGMQSFNELLANKKLQPLRLIWAGVSFESKGGFLALEVVKLLRVSGIDAYIDIIGVNKDQTGDLPGYATVHGFLHKADSNDLAKLESLYSHAHFFIFPTQLDCTPVVLAEANAWGLPCLTTNISGIPSIITDGKNGYKFSPLATAQEYADKILFYVKNEEAYKALSYSSKMEFENRLNWNTAGKSLMHMINKACNQ